ncbi:MAG: hypothetical protein RUMPE_00221 [Eubacteriales bacterium SKADARSKE-1]|nr:hypothetical protein [Eubacteriales bacterium SKADARSKE-1]
MSKEKEIKQQGEELDEELNNVSGGVNQENNDRFNFDKLNKTFSSHSSHSSDPDRDWGIDGRGRGRPKF